MLEIASYTGVGRRGMRPRRKRAWLEVSRRWSLDPLMRVAGLLMHAPELSLEGKQPRLVGWAVCAT